jgi:hypothetical protein
MAKRRDGYNENRRHEEKFEMEERRTARRGSPKLNEKNELFGVREGSFRMPMEMNRSVEWSPYCDQVGMVDERIDETTDKIMKNQRKMFY